MNRIELTLLIAGTFLLAVLLGWLLRWGYTRINEASLKSPRMSNELAARALAAEEARDLAVKDRDDTIADYKNRLRETEAELAAAMEGLGAARRDAEHLRHELSSHRGA